jgi:hypothetical protein
LSQVRVSENETVATEKWPSIPHRHIFRDHESATMSFSFISSPLNPLRNGFGECSSEPRPLSSFGVQVSLRTSPFSRSVHADPP